MSSQRKAPYKHGDGSNCWTKNCRRNTYNSTVPQSSNLIDPIEANLRKIWGNNPKILDMELRVHSQNKAGETYAKYIKPNIDKLPLVEIKPMRGDYFDDDARDVVKSFNKTVETAKAGWTEEQQTALYKYGGIHYSPIREYLSSADSWRQKAKLFDAKTVESGRELINSWEQREDNLKQIIENLDTVTNQPLSLGVPLWRGITPDMEVEPQIISAEQWVDKLGYKEGKVISFESFTSTSIDPAIAERYASNNDYEESAGIVFKIKAKHGVPLEETFEDEDKDFYTQTAEREILLPRNKQYKITKVGRNYRFLRHETSSLYSSANPELFSWSAPMVVELEEI
jgi:hypothetical protein